MRTDPAYREREYARKKAALKAAIARYQHDHTIAVALSKILADADRAS